MTLICPKCGADMRAYERNGVTIDQCTGCRGIFLDRGELERLTDAEAAFYGSPQAAAPAPSRYPEDDRYRGDRDRDRDRDRDDRYRGDSDDYYKKKKRKSFLDELFD